VTALAEAAVEAYLAGWALTGAPFTPRIEAGCIAAVECALGQPRDPGILEAMLDLGHMEGVSATIRQRRERLLRKHLKAIAAAWDACTADLDPRDVVKRFRSAIYLPAEAVTKDPTKRWWQDAAIATALGWLRGVYSAGGYAALVAALEDAIRDGMAEGEADALAMAAARQGVTGFSIDSAFKAASQRLASDHSVSQQAADAVTGIIDGTAGDTGRRLASLAGDDTGEEDMTAGAGDVIAGTSSRLLASFGDTIWNAIGSGAKSLWRWLSGTSDTAVTVDWIAQPGACVLCEENADNGPYAPVDVPAFPGHPNCRCELDSGASVPSSYLMAYLASAD
jgi:hypothetical protein